MIRDMTVLVHGHTANIYNRCYGRRFRVAHGWRLIRDLIGSARVRLRAYREEMAGILYPFQATHLIFYEEVACRAERLLGDLNEKTEQGGSCEASGLGTRVATNCVFALVIRERDDL
jgi:hypothetical protein